MGKTRVGVLFRESVGGKSSNKSADLVALMERYHGWCKKIKSLIEALAKHHQSMAQMEQSRVAVRTKSTAEGGNGRYHRRFSTRPALREVKGSPIPLTSQGGGSFFAEQEYPMLP